MSNLFQDIILLNILLGIWLDYKSENQWRQRRFFAFTFGKSNKMAGLLSDAFSKSRTLLWKSFSLQKSLLSVPDNIFDFVVGKKFAGIMDGTLKVAILPYCTVFENDLKSLILYSWMGSKIHFSSQKYLNFDAQNQHNYHSVNNSSDSSETLWVTFKHCLCLASASRCKMSNYIINNERN